LDIVSRLKANANCKEIFQLTANPPSTTWFGTKIRWIKGNMPDVYERTWKFIPPKDFINFMLTGEACTDPSESSSSYLADWKTFAWLDLLIENLGIEKDKLPVIKKAHEVVGYICKAAAAETGLSEKTVVVCGGGDMPCMLYASGLIKKGIIADITGPFSMICQFTPNPILDSRVMNVGHVLDGWIPFGIIDSSGSAFQWLCDNIKTNAIANAKDSVISKYDVLGQLAEGINTGADGLLFMPYMAGERLLGSPLSKGSYFGLSLSTGPGQMARAMLEGVALELRRSLDVFSESGNTGEQVFHVSEGTASATWNQIKADIYGVPLYTLKGNDGAVLGAALIGGVGAGLFSDMCSAAEAVLQIDKEYLPNPKNRTFYSELYEVFCETHDAMQSPFINLAKFRN
jgi:xylulokinase